MPMAPNFEGACAIAGVRIAKRRVARNDSGEVESLMFAGFEGAKRPANLELGVSEDDWNLYEETK
jgi:hypothetical protein